jgi:hypothetical protein
MAAVNPKLQERLEELERELEVCSVLCHDLLSHPHHRLYTLSRQYPSTHSARHWLLTCGWHFTGRRHYGERVRTGFPSPFRPLARTRSISRPGTTSVCAGLHTLRFVDTRRGGHSCSRCTVFPPKLQSRRVGFEYIRPTARHILRPMGIVLRPWQLSMPTRQTWATHTPPRR